MTYAHVIGRGYEYRVKEWFIKKGWKSERNPLSGASDQIEEELGKHDVRSWREDKDIFLQIECKKTTKDDNVLTIKKEWLDKIDFTNDEFLVFSFQRCKQHFAFMPKEEAEKCISKLKLAFLSNHEPSGDKVFGFKREWLEFKEKKVLPVKFLGKIWYAMDLEVYVDARLRYGGNTNATTFSEKVKTVNSIDKLEKLYKKEEKNLTTRDKRVYYSKLERLESGTDNSYNPDFIKQGQWWLDEKDKFDFSENTIKNILNKVEEWVDANLEEDSDSGDFFWEEKKEISDLEKSIKKILGMSKDKK